jgi:beta-lactamase regulating signal transducer with metallopeptidase domain
MATSLQLVLTNAVAAALVACLALVVSRFVRRPALAHALWLLALVKLVTPPILPLPLLPSWSGFAAWGAGRPAPIVVSLPPSAPLPPASAPAKPSRATSAAGPSARTLPPVTFAASGTAPARPAGAAALAAPALSLLGFGAASVLGLALIRFLRFRKLLAWAEPAPRRLQARAAELAAELGLRRAPPLLLVPARIPPMLWPEPGGPRLLLPQALLGELTEAESSALLAHELAHLRRRDHWVRLVELLATALFWWYPVTWWARASLRRAEERCCDEWVLRVLPQSAEAYAQGLLKSLTFVSSAPAPLPALASGASPLYELELRLKEILMSQPAPRLASPVRLALLGAAALGLAVYPIHAREDEPRAAATPATAAPAAVATPAAAARPRSAAVTPRPAVPATPRASASTPRPSAATPRAAQAAAPAPVPAPALPVTPAAPAAPARNVDDARRALEEHRHAVESKRIRLQQEELEIQRQEIELRARAEEAELRAAADAMRAEGQQSQAERFEKRIGLTQKRAELERRRLELDAARLQFESKVAFDERQHAAKIAALEAEGATERAEAERRRIEDELTKKQREMEDSASAIEKDIETLQKEEQVHAVTEATDELARSIAERAEELEASVRENGGSPDIEREIQKLKAALDALRPGSTPRP